MRRIWESKFLPWVFLLLGLLFSCLIAWKCALWIDEKEQIRFQTASNTITNLIYKELNAHIQLIRSVAAFMCVSPENISREKWKQFAIKNHINEQFLGLRALGYAPLVHPQERLKYEQAVRHEEGFADYAISQKNVSSNTALFPIMYLEPMSEMNEKAFGFDLASEITRREALHQSFIRADATVSSKINLTQKYITDNQVGFSIFFPLYQTKDIPTSTEERLASAKGVLFIAIDAKKMFEQLLKSHYSLVDFEIYDGSAPLEQNLLYNSNPNLIDSRLSGYTSLELYGKIWTLHFKAKEVFEMSDSRYYPWIQMLFSLIFFSVFAGLIYVLQRTRKKAYAIANEKTKQLSQSEAEIRSIFQSMQEGVMVLDDKGVILECNLAAQEMLQLSKSDIVGNFSYNSKWSAIYEDGSVFNKEDYPSLMAINSSLPQNNVILGIRRKDGSLIWVQTNAQPIFSDNFDKIRSVLITFSDITAYRKSKRELEKYLQIIDTHVIISSTDTDGIITEVSEKFCQISGYSKEELIGKSHHLVRHPDMPSTLYEEMWTSLKKGIPWYGEIKNRSKKGVDYWIEAIIAPRYNEEYQLIGYTAVHHDITDKKRVEELSITDRLTGLYNRLKLDELFAYHLSIVKRHQTSFSIILLDIDKFKLVNDTYGHQVGDSLLQAIATLLKRNIREEDAVGRWGGEEFLILLPETKSDAACLLAEKLRRLVEAENFEYAGNRTASFGVATYHANDDETSMVARADEALYRAKEKGRNRVDLELYSLTTS
ncbi:sensor domain-containing diguanylate cyclase [Sulfurospirillum diekertiae]|uniref:Diguanylate cyclase YdaM n=1 Tax=Sulfurospirillum diekertiae TaxID=1854492 RepID=A0A1Y0HHV2_9BACT|nr:diguanylate cyclase [Sulfurospirillum diekertiae]ARU47679.1 putative diguanylate cyclase YdaM [Sulfurospirillum diekertiae]ASC92524.1 putative diguanylate cyclase YdaM [Sulfurospirillum diekertiae]